MRSLILAFVATSIFNLTAALSERSSATGTGSLRVDLGSYVGSGSSGCGKTSPYKAGKTSVATGTYAGVSWTWRVYVPKTYDSNKPYPLIIQHPGWGMNAKSEESGAGITGYADTYGFISVTAQGGNDNPNSGGPWYSWNAAGTTQSPGPGGPTCTSAASAPSYCYTSCGSCSDSPQCWWTTCDETVTPTGVGTKDIGGFIPGLYDTLEDQLCIDTTREYAAGESNGGIMTYQLGVDLHSRLAAIAPQFGSFHKGFAAAPSTGVPVLDMHGSKDTTVPANVSLSADGYYYTTTKEIFEGGKYSSGWMKANGCSGATSHYPTRFDGGKYNFYCVSEGKCSGGDVIRCSWNGGHNWLFNDAKSNGGLVSEFLLLWAKSSHIGKGQTVGSPVPEGHPVNVTSITTEDGDIAPEYYNLTQVLTPQARGHYGDPDTGCHDDEEVLLAGSGRICAPKIGTTASQDTSEPPTPLCHLGGASYSPNGCPTDASVKPHSKAWPTCLAKGNNTDPYNSGSFHCMLVCPCSGIGNSCGAAADAHCPRGARCERGELRNMAHGVCTYHGSD